MSIIYLESHLLNFFPQFLISGADDDDTILKAFEAFEINGKIDAEM